MKISVIQLNAGNSKPKNIEKALGLIERAVQADSPDFVVLPEMVACISASPKEMRDSAEALPDGEAYRAFSDAARRHNIILHIGSMMERDGDEVFNCSLMFGRDGNLLAKYRKIHRFDVVFADGTELKESKLVGRGDEIVCVEVEGVRIGFSICYDMRFPELYRALVERDADIIVAPSAFTFETGAAHWEVLLRARAIETQTYFVAPGQVGTFGEGKYKNFGHSMIIDPWGQIVAQVSNTEGHASAGFDRDYLTQIRARMPLRQHRVL
ncbi:Deaminated glutathione amidase [Cupriavidus yeoncheonensis]|uniref:Deaminated glutathione amidase n=1 Tax=Cupriavidus yeoncheonensis TaxID=1462994 RepID=A0A916J096_9BURK|nr:carbon-nitrogen hydrolase family protein [Cupriavidus yeoncheonensis]CAG2155186.1 Deaminated glutathione amidase [Cupriavidus yeoncheonensis]